MADELEDLARSLNRLIEQEQYADAQAMLPEYTAVLDRRLREDGGDESLKRAIDTFRIMLARARSGRAHTAAQMADLDRARAYVGETAEIQPGLQLLG